MATWDRYKTLETSFEVRVYKGLVFKPRFYCDDAPFAADPDESKPYLRKAPVAKLDVTPRVQFVNQNFTWDISASRSPTSTINTFSVFFNGSPTDLVDQDWSSDPKSGTMAYDAVGEYVVEAYVEDILGVRSQTNSIMVKVIEDAERAYIGTTDSGVFVLEPGSDPVAANNGLSGDHLKLRALHMHPAYRDLPADQQHIWIATAAGLAYSTDGAQSWTTIAKGVLGTPENAAGDDPAPATSALDQIDLAFDPVDVKRVYVHRTKNTAPKRVWLYWTNDYGTNFSNEQVSIA